ncbi:MAG: hypothetical protein NWE98_03230 [Candidatus Bathyarchaeota archaeon]|nr:hypothetical protein [Candidatus Bathyarchaeota archaeon]
MVAPTLGNAMKRTCDNLRVGATKQVTDYETRFSTLKGAYDDILINLIRTGFNQEEAYETAKNFFGTETVRFAGIDGTMYSRSLFDMVVFFGGAYAATGTVRFFDSAKPQVTYDSKTIEQNVGITSVIPIYVNEILDVDHSFSAPEQPNEANPKPATDEEIANNSMIANVVMTFAEFYLAYKLAADISQNFQVLLLDRCLSTERASLLYESRKISYWMQKSALVGYKINDKKVDENDLALARHHVYNKALGLPAPRADFLLHAIAFLAQEHPTLTESQICDALGIADEKRRKRVEKTLSNLVSKHILTCEEGVYALNTRYADSWSRIKQLTVEIGDHLFSIKDGLRNVGSMKIFKDGCEHWLTTIDITFLTLFALHMLVEECWRKNILLIGITKDTTARDFKRQLVPIMQSECLLKTAVGNEAFLALPNTDRMILQSASVFNPDKMVPPWSMIEYDSAFRTMKPDLERGRGYVAGVIKNKIGLEKAFLKTYVQLSQARSDPLLRSNVLLIDRLAYPQFDQKPECSLTLLNEKSDRAKEPIEVLLYKDKFMPNKMQNLVMCLLVAMAPMDIPEAFGHNKPLFAADKIAKWNYNQFKAIADSTACWILNNHKLRKFIFYMSTFRERRTNIEQTRRQTP